MSDHSGLAEALLAAQADMPAIEPDATNPHFKSRFVSLGNLLSKVRPVLREHGLVVMQAPHMVDGQPAMRVVLVHVSSGERETFDAPLPMTKNDPQALGSSITYLRRYTLASLLGISDQEDDDGNAGSGKAPEADPNAATATQKSKLSALLAEGGAKRDEQIAFVRSETGDKPLTKEVCDGLIQTLADGPAEGVEAWRAQQ